MKKLWAVLELKFSNICPRLCSGCDRRLPAIDARYLAASQTHAVDATQWHHLTHGLGARCLAASMKDVARHSQAAPARSTHPTKHMLPEGIPMSSSIVTIHPQCLNARGGHRI